MSVEMDQTCLREGRTAPSCAVAFETMSRKIATMNDQELVERLLEAMDKYGPYYDDVFWEVSARVRERGDAGKMDLAALICWRRSGQGHWVSELMELPEAQVRDRSREAFEA